MTSTPASTELHVVNRATRERRLHLRFTLARTPPAETCPKLGFAANANREPGPPTRSPERPAIELRMTAGRPLPHNHGQAHLAGDFQFALHRCRCHDEITRTRHAAFPQLGVAKTAHLVCNHAVGLLGGVQAV